MSELRTRLAEYLIVRRSLGYELQRPAQRLHDFVTFLEGESTNHITTDLALKWSMLPSSAAASTWAERLGIVRRFASWCATSDPQTEVPTKGLLPHRYRRKPPYIYSDNEIDIIVDTTMHLSSANGLRAHTYATIFGLLAVTGMRINEVLSLNRQDVDVEEGLLTVLHTKGGNSRVLPVHLSTREALAAYALLRDRIVPVCFTKGFFVNERGLRITAGSARYTFAEVSRSIGLRHSERPDCRGRGPRLHDIRHRFAVRTMLDWYRAGLDVGRETPKLSAYLGHVHMNHTYWYLEAVPELLELATARLDDRGKESGS